MVFARSQHCGATQKLLNKKSQVAKVEVLWRLEAAASCSCHSGDLLNLSRSIPTYANMTCTELHETFTGFLLVESAQRVRWSFKLVLSQRGGFVSTAWKCNGNCGRTLQSTSFPTQYDENTESKWHETAEHLQAHETCVKRKKNGLWMDFLQRFQKEVLWFCKGTAALT